LEKKNSSLRALLEKPVSEIFFENKTGKDLSLEKKI